MADLELSPTDGIYLMGVHVLQDGDSDAVGRARVFVPVLDEPPESTLQLTSVVVLSTQTQPGPRRACCVTTTWPRRWVRRAG